MTGDVGACTGLYSYVHICVPKNRGFVRHELCSTNALQEIIST
jgi:hypothetical protein